VPGVIHPDDVKDELGDIDAEYGDGLCHGTCLLWVNGLPTMPPPFWLIEAIRERGGSISLT
jgi:hypothetical protein